MRQETEEDKELRQMEALSAAREKRLAELKGALERLANPEPMAFLQSLEADARIEFARSALNIPEAIGRAIMTAHRECQRNTGSTQGE